MTVVKHATLTPQNYTISIGYSADRRPTTAPNNRPSTQASKDHSPVTVRRTGLASFLFAILRPGDARAATVDANAVRLTLASRSTEIALGNIEAAHRERGLLWAGISIRHVKGKTAISGLSRNEAGAFCDALEKARVEWWRRVLATRSGTLCSAHDRLTQLADPPKYITDYELRDLKREAESAVSGFVTRWPSALSNAPEIRMLKSILEFLEAPDRARVKANEAFVANELRRSSAFLDRIEAQPLTDEQRKAVVFDERRNLVVAAAGSAACSCDTECWSVVSP